MVHYYRLLHGDRSRAAPGGLRSIQPARASSPSSFAPRARLGFRVQGSRFTWSVLGCVGNLDSEFRDQEPLMGTALQSTVERGGYKSNGSEDVCAESGSIQGQNLALTVVYVPKFLDSGLRGDLVDLGGLLDDLVARKYRK